MAAPREIDWNLLIGYNQIEAEQVLCEEGVPYEILLSAPPNKVAGNDDVRVIATRVTKDNLQLICGNIDWSVN